MGKISIIIPTYNRKAKIIRAIDSVLSQTVKPHEILICDDGSTDGTEVLVRQIRNTRIRWVPGKHTGLPAVPRNRGVQLAKGDWIAFLDSDDWWEKNKLEKQFQLIKKLQVKAVCSNAYIVNPHSDKKERLYFSKTDVKNVFGFNELLTTNYVICSSFLVEKRLVIECGMFPEEPTLKAIEDYALWLRISTKTKIGYSKTPLVHYFNNPDNSIRTVWQNVTLQKKVILRNLYAWLIGNSNKNNRNALFIIKTLVRYIENMVF